MKKKIILFIIPVLIVSCNVQRVSNSSEKYISLSRKNYIENYKELAINEMRRSGIPASITLAQA